MATGKAGSIQVWIDGVKLIEYKDIKTCANANPTIGNIMFGGTIAQPAYDAPPHLRKFDALLLSDNWQNIVDVGYMDPKAKAENLKAAELYESARRMESRPTEGNRSRRYARQFYERIVKQYPDSAWADEAKQGLKK